LWKASKHLHAHISYNPVCHILFGTHSITWKLKETPAYAASYKKDVLHVKVLDAFLASKLLSNITTKPYSLQQNFAIVFYLEQEGNINIFIAINGTATLINNRITLLESYLKQSSLHDWKSVNHFTSLDSVMDLMVSFFKTSTGWLI